MALLTEGGPHLRWVDSGEPTPPSCPLSLFFYRTRLIHPIRPGYEQQKENQTADDGVGWRRSALNVGDPNESQHNHNWPEAIIPATSVCFSRSQINDQCDQPKTTFENESRWK